MNDTSMQSIDDDEMAATAGGDLFGSANPFYDAGQWIGQNWECIKAAFAEGSPGGNPVYHYIN